MPQNDALMRVDMTRQAYCSGDFNVGNWKVTNVKDPVVSTDGATKNYVDTSITTATATSVLTTGSYADPSWITSLGWGKITGTPTTLSGYGITDAARLSGAAFTGNVSVAGGLSVSNRFYTPYFPTSTDGVGNANGSGFFFGFATNLAGYPGNQYGHTFGGWDANGVSGPTPGYAFQIFKPYGLPLVYRGGATATTWSAWETMLTSGQVFSVTAFGNHSFTAAGTGVNALNVRNTVAGSGNFAQVGAQSDSTACVLQHFSSAYTTTADTRADGARLISTGVGGLCISVSHASGVLAFYTAGVERMRIWPSGGISINGSDPAGPGISLGGSFAVSGSFMLGATSNWTPSVAYALPTSGVNVVNPGNGTVVRITGSGGTISGISGGSDGRMVLLLSTAAGVVTFQAEDVNVVAASRIANSKNSTSGLTVCVYDGTSQRWRIT